MTPASASQVDHPTRQNAASGRGAPGGRTAGPAPPARRSRPPHRDAERHDGELERRRGGDEAGVDVDAGRQARLGRHLQVGEDPGDLGLLLGGQGACRAGDADEVARRPRRARPRCAACCTRVRAIAARGATAATESRKATTTVSALARTNRPLRLASIPAGGMVENTRPPAAGSDAIAWQGMLTSSDCGAPETSGAVMSVTLPSAPGACGHWMGPSVLVTGRSRGQAAQQNARECRRRRRRSARSGWRRRCRWARGSMLGEAAEPIADAMRALRHECAQVGRSGAGLQKPLRVAVPRSRRAGCGVGIERVEPLQRAPVPEPVVLEIGRHGDRAVRAVR